MLLVGFYNTMLVCMCFDVLHILLKYTQCTGFTCLNVVTFIILVEEVDVTTIQAPPLLNAQKQC